jgi:Zn-finger nucleic acid-binding protein
MLITCVRCNSVLDKATIAGMEVDLCPSCGGLWLDRGELERLNRVPRDAVEQLRFALTGGEQAGVSPTQTACPACPGALQQVKLGRVLIDYCEKCRGVFLDKGELDAAMAAVRGASVDSVLALAGAVSARAAATAM